jgi:single-strand DNA-binding protein
MNSWNFTGNTGKDAEVKCLANGDPITSFSVAVKSGYGKNEVTSWVNCSIYGARGEAVAKFIKKGAQIGVSGEGLLRTWDAKDGSKGSSLECRVSDVTLLGKKDGESVSQQRQAPQSNDKESAWDDSDDIGF